MSVCVMCMYTFVAFMNVRVCECVCVSACVGVHACLESMYAFMRLCACVFLHSCVRLHACMNVYIYVYVIGIVSHHYENGLRQISKQFQ